MSAATRFDTLAQAHPEWAAWLRVVRELAGELSNAAWDANPAWSAEEAQAARTAQTAQAAQAAPTATATTTAAATSTTTTPTPPTAGVPDLAPALAGAALRPDGRALAHLLDRLSAVARAQGLHALAGQGGQETSPDEARALFLAAVNGDPEALDQHAARTGATSEGFRTLAQLLPMPYLHACARRWASSPTPPWSQGYCPVCGAWPAFAEVRGVERTRHLRCGRCGAGWPMPVLACTYCGTTDHETLGTLVVDDKTARFSLDVCHGCSGYLKSCTALQATPSDEILAVDLASVEFDLAAVERGFLRPAGPGVALHASLAPADQAMPSAPGWSS